MNRVRRKELNSIIRKLDKFNQDIKSKNNITISELSSIISDIELALSDEAYYMDSIPENMQSGSKYEKAEEACENLENAINELNRITRKSSIQDIDEFVNNALSYISDAMV